MTSTTKRRMWILLLFGLLALSSRSQPSIIETVDIRNFWEAFDRLAQATDREDSIAVMQQYYIEPCSDFFKEFLRVRDFTAEEYVRVIGRYPGFWRSIRPLTERIAQRVPEIHAVFDRYRELLPGFSQPDVCFAIGCLRTGGTTASNLILIGSEIAAADGQVDKSEMSGWLSSVIGTTGDIVAMIAHETVHTQQINRGRRDLITRVLTEGVADFMTIELLGMSINAQVFSYGRANECALWKEFARDLDDHPRDFRRWLYQGNSVDGRPADLGYFIGCRIAQCFYEKESDKQRALRTLLDARQYRKVYEKSRYWEESCRDTP